MTSIKKIFNRYYGIVKNMLERGRSWVGIVQFIIVFLTATKVYGIPSSYSIPLVIIGVFGTLLIGYLDIYVFRTYEAETAIYKKIHPVWREMLENEKRIQTDIDKMKEKLGIASEKEVGL